MPARLVSPASRAGLDTSNRDRVRLPISVVAADFLRPVLEALRDHQEELLDHRAALQVRQEAFQVRQEAYRDHRAAFQDHREALCACLLRSVDSATLSASPQYLDNSGKRTTSPCSRPQARAPTSQRRRPNEVWASCRLHYSANERPPCFSVPREDVISFCPQAATRLAAAVLNLTGHAIARLRRTAQTTDRLSHRFVRRGLHDANGSQISRLRRHRRVQPE
jgi:hypothetical protein